MVVLWFLLSIFGLMTAVRTWSVCESLRIFPEKHSESLAIFISALVLGMNFLLRMHLWAQIFFQAGLFSAPNIFSQIIFFTRETRILKNFVSILDSVVVQMQVGASLRESLMMSAATQTPSTQFLLQEFITLLSFDRPISELVSHKHLQSIFGELKKIDQQPHRAIERLKSLRRRLQIEKKLRQKSRKALLQVHAQAIILSLMYLALLSYSLWKYEWKNFSSLFWISFLLFSGGSFWLWQIGRRFRWKT